MQVKLDVLIAQLVAARAQIDATLTTLGVVMEGGEEREEPENTGECPHPQDKVVDLSTFDGGSLYQCTLCDTISTVPFPS